MHQRFDIRTHDDRRRLSELLPTIDGTTFLIPADRFEDLLEAIAGWLGNQDWLTYQDGAFILGAPGRARGPVGLETLVHLANRLEALSGFSGFDEMLGGLRNATQFHDTIFETRVAELFIGLPGFLDLQFAPSYRVRRSIKRPDLRVSVAGKTMVAEAKAPKLFFQRAGRKFDRDVVAFNSALDEAGWPSHLRLEIQMKAPPREMVIQLARRVVSRALTLGVGQFEDLGLRAYVVSKSEPFVTEDHGFVSNTLAPTEATGPFNSHATKFRMVNGFLFDRTVTSVGSTLSDALSQLPPEEDCMIVVGDVPTRIVAKAISVRLQDPAYAHVKLFGNWYDAPIEFFFREADRNLLNIVFPGAG
jgi:hypothetical protein